jgi:hypothetical protein
MSPPVTFDFQQNFKKINLSSFTPQTSGVSGSDQNTVAGVDRQLIQNEFVFNQGNTPALLSDLISKRPVPSLVGRIFLATDTFELFRDTGTSWVSISLAAQSAFLSPTGVAPGTYNSVTVGVDGRITAGSQVAALTPMPGLNVGTYDTLTVNSYGLITAATNSDFVKNRAKYQSPAASIMHTFQHNLNTMSIEVYVLVQDPVSMLWSNDIVRTDVIDNNNIEVWLTQASQVLINVIKLD